MDVCHLVTIPDKHYPTVKKEVLAEFGDLQQAFGQPQLVQSTQHGFG